MSGRGNDNRGQGGNQGGQQGHGGQQQGGQGQPAQGGQGQPAQGGQGQPRGAQGQATPQQGQVPRQQAGRGGSITDYATNGTTVAYTKFFGATYALIGVAAGLAVFLVSVVGGAPLAPDVAVDPGQFINNYEAIKTQYYVNRLAYQTMNATPLVAALLGVVGGIYVGTSVDGPDEQAYATSAVSSFVGAFALVIVGGILASLAIGTIPMPEASDSAQALAGGTSTEQLQQAEGVASAILIGGTKLEFGGLIINALLTAIATGVLAVGGAYISRNLAPSN